MLSYESLHISAPPLQCQTKWTIQPCVHVCRPLLLLLLLLNLLSIIIVLRSIMMLTIIVHLRVAVCIKLFSLSHEECLSFQILIVFLLHTYLLIQTLISHHVDIAKLRGMGEGRWIEKIEHLLEQMRHGGRSKRAHLYDP